jgi:hypothetical protein
MSQAQDLSYGAIQEQGDYGIFKKFDGKDQITIQEQMKKQQGQVINEQQKQELGDFHI